MRILVMGEADMRILVMGLVLVLTACGSPNRVDEEARGKRRAALDKAALVLVPGARRTLSGPYSSLTLDGSLTGPNVSDAELRLAIVDVSEALEDGSPASQANLLVAQARLHAAAFTEGGLVRIASHGTGTGSFQRFGDHIYAAGGSAGVRVAAGRASPGAGPPPGNYLLQEDAPRWVVWSAYASPGAGATAFVRMELDRGERLLLIEISYSDRSLLDQRHAGAQGGWSETISTVE